MPNITIRNLRDDLSFGALVEGLDWSNMEDEATRQSLRDTFVERGMIVFKDMEPSARMQVAVSKVFGPLKDHPTKTTPRDKETGDEAAGVIDMHYKPNLENPEAGEGLVEYKGEVLARYSPWHFDHCYNDELNYAGVLRAPINAPVGGRTGFMDGIELYRRLPQALRDRLEGKNVIYTLDTRLSKMKYGVNLAPLTENSGNIALLKEVAIFPRAIHPAVWERETGEKVLHFGPWMAVALEHDETAAGDALLDEVAHEMNRLGESTAAYWHDWSPTDMVIWDNHRMLHAVEGCSARYERQTLRTTIKGDYGLGYFEDGKKIGEVYREVA
ncbi:TauD/TfdA family dioxygenase [Novosphingobium sp. 9U]|uniref:TauD/TfdA dioxygenase family protein n=1 Tax=Novosphingobium sp. 9U TaxID=2653158 RepID=UPI0012F17638|nr:TauD/TfdA family dioxygenase [Novosphingobium sp. 9U]VWX51877.1 Putative taurine catabolism dioxygenase [Novosphingobium sp. 9U]